MRYGFVIDQTTCIGCHACTVACKEENGVALGSFRTWVKYIERGEFPSTRRYFSVLRCNHCDNAPCVTICPTSALYRRPDGIVDFDKDVCIGCKSCMQACPYDALYIDPETQTAAKCHFCAHRVEKKLEPACVIVCPVQAILAGDLDDPASEVSQVIARQQVSVRKPEQGTIPKLYYLGADAASLAPQVQAASASYMWSRRPADAPPPPPPRLPEEGALGRVVYDVEHAPRPWGVRVSSYLWTKSVAAGAALIAGLGTLAGWAPARGLALPLVAITFLVITTALLILDLKRPDRFHLILLRPNMRSWLVLGTWILIAFGAIAGLWLLAVTNGKDQLLTLLAAPLGALALGAAGYSAFLFNQAEGRDFWQSPLLLPHLLAAAITAGAATALLLHEPEPMLRALLVAGLGVNLFLILAECFTPHANMDVAAAARMITRGPWRRVFWLGVVAFGSVVPAALLIAGASPMTAIPAALLALAGLYLWEDCWVKAGQSVPLS